MARGALSAKAFRRVAGEGSRYLVASGLALTLDFGVYVGLIRLAGVAYLVAAPIGFTLGLAAIYALSVRWVFTHRRLADARVEFAIFSIIGVAGLGLNQLVLFVAVDRLSAPYELAKLASAAIVFCFNFGLRRLLLFTARKVVM